MRVAVRTDAAVHIGTGHVMRCLTLADQLRASGAEVVFVCREHQGHLCSFIEIKGYRVARLPQAQGAGGSDAGDQPSPRRLPENKQSYAAWLGVDWTLDAKQTLAVLGEGVWDWLIVDHYGLDGRWHGTMRQRCRRVMVIDDLAEGWYDCDLLLNQNLGSREADYANGVSPGCRILAGAKYALLRPEFSAMRATSLARRERPQLKQLLLSMGGVDRHNATGAVLAALKNCALPPDCRITVAMGAQAPWLEAVRKTAASVRWDTRVLCDAANMAQLMTVSDLAIGAAGSSSWERCCLGLPTLTVVVAANQAQAAEYLEGVGATINLGFADQLAAPLAEAVDRIGADLDLLRVMSAAAANVVDGRGTTEVAQRVLGLSHAPEGR